MLAEWAEEAVAVGAAAPIDDRSDGRIAAEIAAAEPDPERRRAVFREAHRLGKALRFVREDWTRLAKAAKKTANEERRCAELERQAEAARRRFADPPATAPPSTTAAVPETEAGRAFAAQIALRKAREHTAEMLQKTVN